MFRAAALTLLILLPVLHAAAVPATPQVATAPAPERQSNGTDLVSPAASDPGTPARVDPAPPSAALPDGPRIVAAYPNPVASGDAGEFVVVRFPEATHLAGWALADDDATVRLPNATVEGRVGLATDPTRARNLTDARVVALPDGFRLANGGESLRLVSRGMTVDAVSYRDAPEGELRRWTGAVPHRRWRPLGSTDRPVVRTDGASARVFVLPDSAGVPVDVLRAADRRVLLAGYTLTSRRVAAALVGAVRRGVRVRVLVDGEPVGGMSRREARILDRLVAAGVEVDVLGGPRARYEFHHAKYAVADDRALVLTENWKPAGTGGRSSRGWGVVLDDPAVARALAATFRADAGWRDARNWRAFRRGRTFEGSEVANGTYPSRFPPRRVSIERAAVLVAPDNAERAVVARIDRADESLRVVQASVGGRDQPFLRAALRAARRGVRVRILLSGAWYVAEENRRLVEWLNDRAAEEGLPLKAALADPQGRYGKIHAKGVVVDGETAILGSLNWNNHSARENREVVVALEGEKAARYYGRVFRADWRGGAWRLPAGVGVAVVVGAASAVLTGRRIDFEPHD